MTAEDDRWERWFARLKASVDRVGVENLRPSTALGRWLDEQRKLNAAGALTEARTRRLAEVGLLEAGGAE